MQCSIVVQGTIGWATATVTADWKCNKLVIKRNSPVKPVTDVRQVSPLHPGLVERAQQSAAEQSEDRSGQRQPLLRVTIPFEVSGGPAAVLGGEEAVFFFSTEVVVSRDLTLSEVLAADVLEDGEAQRAEQEVPGLVLLLHEAAGGQAEGVSDGAGEQQNIQLREPPLAAAASGWRLWGWGGQWVADKKRRFEGTRIFSASSSRSSWSK